MVKALLAQPECCIQGSQIGVALPVALTLIRKPVVDGGTEYCANPGEKLEDLFL